MHSSGSGIRTIVERVRFYLDEPELNAKYTDDYVVRHLIGPAHADVFARINLTSQTRFFLQYDFACSGAGDYPLPPCINSVMSLQVIDELGGTPNSEITPRSLYHAEGPAWLIKGNPGAYVLGFYGSSPDSDQFLRINYTSNGDVQMHLGTGTLSHHTTYSKVALAATPTMGLVDRRTNAYAGQYLRIIPTTGPVEEVPISSSYFSSGTWYVETTRLLSTTAGSVTYEIVPAAFTSMWDAISCWAAMRLGIPRSKSAQKAAELRTAYLASIKTCFDAHTYANERMGLSIEKDTIDNNENGYPFRRPGQPQ